MVARRPPRRKRSGRGPRSPVPARRSRRRTHADSTDPAPVRGAPPCRARASSRTPQRGRAIYDSAFPRRDNATTTHKSPEFVGRPVVAAEPKSRSPSIEVVIYFGFLLAFMGLLALVSVGFGLVPLDIVFAGFIVVVLGCVVVMDRVIG